MNTDVIRTNSLPVTLPGSQTLLPSTLTTLTLPGSQTLLPSTLITLTLSRSQTLLPSTLTLPLFTNTPRDLTTLAAPPQPSSTTI